MKEPIRTVKFDPIEFGLIVNALNQFRDDLINEDSPTEDVDSLLLKIIDTPIKTTRMVGHETR